MGSLVAQLTDTHVVAEGQTLPFGVDPNAALDDAVARVTALAPRPDVALLTGDLTDHGTDAEYEALLSRLDRLHLPLLPVAGNHDERTGLRAAFPDLADRCGTDGFWQWVHDLDDLRIVALDSTIEGRHDGELCDVRLRWLADVLAAEPDRTTMVALHHPPFRTGIWWMDEGGLRRGGPDLRAVVEANPQVRAVVCGHHHRSITTSWGTAVVTVAPSTAHQVHLDLVPESPARFTTEPGGFAVHAVDDGAIVTHAVASAHPDLVELGPIVGGWDRFREQLRGDDPLYK